jgi:hypothetical protein
VSDDLKCDSDERDDVLHGAATEREARLAKIVDELGEDSTNLVEHRGNKIRCCIGSVNIS